MRNIPHLAYFNWKQYLEFLGTYNPINLWKVRYFRKKFVPGINIFKELILSKEYGLDAEPHIHAFLRTSEPVFFNTIRKYFRRFKYKGKSLLRKVELAKSAKTVMRYITKEDYKAHVHQVDKECLNNNYIMFGFAKNSERIHPGQYAYFRWNQQCQRNKYVEIHDWYWKEKRKAENLKKAMKLVNMDILKLCRECQEKGLYLYGSSGTGKSTLAFAISGGDYYMIVEDKKFAFNTWYGEQYLLFEDFTPEQLMRFRLNINQLTDMFGFTTSERKCNSHVVVSCKKLIVTSNFPPPTESQWPGFHRRFLCINFDETSALVDLPSTSQTE